MLTEWLYRTTLELSLLIGLVLLLRPVVRRPLGARAAYWLWSLPMIRAVLIDRPTRPQLVIEAIGTGRGNFDVFPSPEAWVVPASVPWATIWIAGAAVWIAFRMIAWIRFRRALESGAVPFEFDEETLASPPEISMARRLSFITTDLPGAPFVTGLRHPRVCLPRDFGARFPADQQAWIIRHELMHIARHDLWIRFAWELLRATFWFNPVVHIGARAMCDDQELACDQAIVGRCDSDARYRYGKTLIAGVGLGAADIGSEPMSIPFFDKHRERIVMIARHRASRFRDGAGLVLCLALGACALTSAPPPVVQDSAGEPITFKFDDLELRAALQILAEFAHVNVVISDQIPKMNITMAAQDVPWDDVLRQLVNCVGAEISRSGNVIVISPAADGEAVGECAAS